jgi:hypothetical protein
VGRGTEPQGRRGWLHRLVHDREQLGRERVQVDLVTQPGTERLDGLGGVVLAAVEAPIAWMRRRAGWNRAATAKVAAATAQLGGSPPTPPFFTEIRPSPWRQGVDLANMLLVLALRSDPKQVYARAVREFSVQEVSEAFAATRGLTMPSQLRRMLRAQGRDLHGEFLRLLPEPPRPIAIQRFTPRRLGLTLAVLIGGLAVAYLAAINQFGLGLAWG